MKIGVDLGGTNIRVGAFIGNKLLKKVAAPCPSRKGLDDLMTCLCSLIESVRPDVNYHAIESIGIGIPGLYVSQYDYCTAVSNVPALNGASLAALLKGRFHCHVSVNNDSNCFALGLARYGDEQRFSSFVGVTLGTGLGTGIIINGRLLFGRNTGAGELGGIPFMEHNYEYYCSKPFFDNLHGIDALELGERVRRGDHRAVEIFQEYGRCLGAFVRMLMRVYDPEAVIFGGGIANNMPYFRSALLSELSGFDYPCKPFVGRASIMDASLYGSAVLCQEYCEEVTMKTEREEEL